MRDGGDRDHAAGVGLAVVGLRSLKDLALVGGAADLERLAVEVFAAQGQHLPQPQAAVGEDADHRLVAAGHFGEAVHLLEAGDADRPRLLLRPRVVGPDADALEGVEVADFVGDRVLGHCREGAEDSYGPPVVTRPSVLSMWSTGASGCHWRRRVAASRSAGCRLWSAAQAKTSVRALTQTPPTPSSR